MLDMAGPNEKVSDLRARLSATGSKLSEISKKAAAATTFEKPLKSSSD